MMNPKQRKGMVLLAVAGVGAVAVMTSVSSYVSKVHTEVGAMTTVLRLSKDLPAFKAVTADMVEEATMPRRWAPKTAIHQAGEVLGQVAAGDLPRGSVLETGVLQPPPQLQPGQREVAIMIDAETGVAGKVEPGSVVDIYATFDGNQGTVSRSQIIVAGAKVIEVGLPTTKQADTKTGFGEQGKVIPVTFALSVQDSLVLTYAESFATKVRLGLVSGADKRTTPPDTRSFQLAPQPGKSS
jgi:pilus assembly protein CpaB